MDKEFHYLMTISLTELESNHLGYYLTLTRKLLNIKQCRVIEKTLHCDSTIIDLERQFKNPYFHTLHNYLKAIGLEFYAFVNADNLLPRTELSETPLMLVQVTPDELSKIKKNA